LIGAYDQFCAGTDAALCQYGSVPQRFRFFFKVKHFFFKFCLPPELRFLCELRVLKLFRFVLVKPARLGELREQLYYLFKVVQRVFIFFQLFWRGAHPRLRYRV
jgi:hypothetical protein